MSFFVSDSLKDVISENDISIDTSIDGTFSFCLNDTGYNINELYIKENFFIININVNMSQIEPIINRTETKTIKFKIGKTIIDLQSNNYKIVSIKSCDLLNFVDVQILIQYNGEL